MDRHFSEDLARRIDSLRGANRRLSSISILLASLVVLVLLAGSQPKSTLDVIDARHIVLRDKQGMILSDLHVNADGLASLSFYDQFGKERMSLGIWKEYSHVQIRDDDNNPVITMRANRIGSAHLELSEPDGKRITLISSGRPDNNAEISFGEPEGPDKLRIALDSDKSEINMLHPDSKHQIRFICDEQLDCRILMKDGRGDRSIP